MATLSIALLIAAAGIDTGWQPLSDGRFEYILQLEPAVVESLRAGQEVASDIPATMRGARSYRLTVGEATLPRRGVPASPTPAAGTGAVDVTTLKAPAEQFGWQSLEGGGFECILQLDAARLDALAAGKELLGELPAFLQDVRTYRIVMGSKSLPRDAIASESGAPPSGNSPPAVETDKKADLSTAAPAQSIKDSFVREASAEMPPSLPSAVTATKADPQPTRPETVSQTAYSQANLVTTPAATDETGGPSSDAPPQGDLIPQQLRWHEPYTVALIGLFTSVGMNLYLGWVTWNANHRYRILRRQVVGDRPAIDG